MTATNALIATLTKPTRPAKATTGTGGCRAKAPCGGRCCLDASVRHELHICNDEGCYCHTEERYRGAKEERYEQQRAGAAFAEPN